MEHGLWSDKADQSGYTAKVKKGHYGKYFLKSKSSVLKGLPKIKKGQFGKYFLKLKMVTLGNTS